MARNTSFVAIHEMDEKEPIPGHKPVSYWLQLVDGKKSILLAISSQISSPPEDSQLVDKFHAWKNQTEISRFEGHEDEPQVFLVGKSSTGDIEFRATKRTQSRIEHDGEVLYVWPNSITKPSQSLVAVLRRLCPRIWQIVPVLLMAVVLILVGIHLGTTRNDLSQIRNLIIELESGGASGQQNQRNQAIQSTDEMRYLQQSLYKTSHNAKPEHVRQDYVAEQPVKEAVPKDEITDQQHATDPEDAEDAGSGNEEN